MLPVSCGVRLPYSERRSWYSQSLNLWTFPGQGIKSFSVQALPILDVSVRQEQISVAIYSGSVAVLNPCFGGGPIALVKQRDIDEDAVLEDYAYHVPARAILHNLVH